MKIPELVKSPFVVGLVLLIVVSFFVPWNEFGEGNAVSSTAACVKSGSVMCIIFAIVFVLLLVYSLIAFIRGMLNLKNDKPGSNYHK